MEVVHPRDGGAVTLRPCPPWCIEDRHFADHGYHQYGPAEVPTSHRFLGLANRAETVIRLVLKSWTHPLEAEPGPALIELNLAKALLDLAATAERAEDNRVS